MIDLVKLKLQAGSGGDGLISLHRGKFRPKGGPDGGDGGDGGNIIIRGDRNLNTLRNFAGAKEYAAQDGQNGRKRKKHGGDGGDIILDIPLGTIIWLRIENKISYIRRKKYERLQIDFDFATEDDDFVDKEANLDEIEQNDTSQVEQDVREENNKAGDKCDENKNEVVNSGKNTNLTKSSTVNVTTTAETVAKKDEKLLEQDPFRLNVLLERDELDFKKYYKKWDGSFVSEKEPDEMKEVMPEEESVEAKKFTNLDDVLDSTSQQMTTIKLAEIQEHNQQLVLCQGGFGGRGNYSFRSSSIQTPLMAEHGTYGEKKELILELRLLADLGLVGLPNAGKSTLLSRLTKAHPKIANYPFTTLEPNLGVLASSEKNKELVVADIPGLIEGASQGKGLGDRFLRHIENCQALLYVLFLEEHLVFDSEISVKEKVERLWQQYLQLKKELAEHHKFLLNKPYLVSLNKIDLYPDKLEKAIKAKFKREQEELLLFSGVTGEGLEQLETVIFRSIKD